MKGLLRKIFIEVRWPVLFFGLGLALIMFILTVLLPKILGDVDEIFSRLPFVRPLIEAIMNVEIGDGGFTEQLTQSFLWVHPTVLAITWAHALMYCSRVPAAEIDRGSIDFLLGLPLSRWRLFIAESIGCVLTGAFILLTGFAGHWIGATTIQPGMRPGAFASICIMSNLLAVYLSVSTLAFFVSSLSDRRGRAIGIVFAILLVSFLITFLARFWPPAESISFISIMKYYRPALTIRSDSYPWQDVGILLGVAAVLWTAAGVTLRRRSICTV